MRPRIKGSKPTRGSALLEFAIVLPLVVVFVVGIYDFSGAYNQKQKIEHAARVGAGAAAGQATGDMDSPNPDSLQPVVEIVFNSLAEDGVLRQANQGSCKTPAGAPAVGAVSWTYTIISCPDDLTITIDRGFYAQPAVTTRVTVSYPYRWQFNRVIQLLIPGPSSYAATTNISQTATVHNQM